MSAKRGWAASGFPLPLLQLCIVLLLAMQGATGQAVTPTQVHSRPHVPARASALPAQWRFLLKAAAGGSCSYGCRRGMVGMGEMPHIKCRRRLLPPAQAEVTWRVQFAVGTAICLGLTIYRWMLLQANASLLTAWQQGSLPCLKQACTHLQLQPALHAAWLCALQPWIHGWVAL